MKVCVLVRHNPVTSNGGINSHDLQAVKEAVGIRKRFCREAEITVISLGPPAAVGILRSALTLGCGKAYLLSDPGFGGSDTWSTSYALMKGIETAGSFDLILCGDGTPAGGSGEVGPAVAAHFDIPVITAVSCIEALDDGWIVARRALEGGHEVIEAPLPLLLTCVRKITEPCVPAAVTDLYAAKTNIHTLRAEDIGVDADRMGLRNSLTSLVKVYYADETRCESCAGFAGKNFVQEV
jgi:electron transfer flavoprotein beta subunit